MLARVERRDHDGPVIRAGAQRGESLAGAALGGLGSVLVAIALVPLRGEIDNTNLALVLVVVVVGAAITGGRAAGAVAAVTSTLAFDFFLARPYLSMRLESADDVETVLILLVVGLLVGEVASRGRRARRRSERATRAVARVQRVAEQVARGARADEVVAVVTRELTELLDLHDCWLELPPYSWPLPRLERSGVVSGAERDWVAGGFVLPADGVELGVLGRGNEVARLVLLGKPVVPLMVEDRVVAVALADQLGSVLALASPEELDGLGKPGG